MAKLRQFQRGETLIAQGDQRGNQDAIAYIIRNGWVQVQRQRTEPDTLLINLGPGEIVGELGLMGLAPARTASVVALTDGQMEVIDHATMIRLANGSAKDIVPLLASLFSRLQSLQLQQNTSILQQDGSPQPALATIAPDNALADQVLCGHAVTVTHLPWVFGAYRPPTSVTELLRPPQPAADIRLPTPDPTIAPNHLTLQRNSDGEFELFLAHAGDLLVIDDEPVAKIPPTQCVVLAPGEHRIAFGRLSDPYAFRITT
ncbi:MAG: cyclic nucleotide-binding domain-containing protein [Mariprofundales bacterium]|nr:cyclic nucleotide-binding domain-containing protein [Mariprofundales bacterium]